jgi:hypothetical protein
MTRRDLLQEAIEEFETKGPDTEEVDEREVDDDDS